MTLRKKYLKVTWSITGIWAFIVLILSTVPASAFPQTEISYMDKAFHFGEFIVLALLMTHAFKYAKVSLAENSLFTLILAGGYGILMELTQLYVPGRSASIYDIMADLAGVAVGVLIAKVVLYGRNQTI